MSTGITTQIKWHNTKFLQPPYFSTSCFSTPQFSCFYHKLLMNRKQAVYKHFTFTAYWRTGYRLSTPASFTLVFRKSKLWLLASPKSAFFLTQHSHTLILYKADNFLLLLLYCRVFNKGRIMKLMEISTERGKDKRHQQLYEKSYLFMNHKRKWRVYSFWK